MNADPLLSPLEKEWLVYCRASVLAFLEVHQMNGLPFESFAVWKNKRVLLGNVSFPLFYLSPLTWDLLKERKQENSRDVAKAPKINQRPPSCPKEHSLHVPTRATSWTPAVSSCAGSSAAGYWSEGSPVLWPVGTVEHIPGGSTGSSLIFWRGLCLHLLS